MTLTEQVETIADVARAEGNSKVRQRALGLLVPYESWNRLCQAASTKRLRKLAELERADVEEEMAAFVANLGLECGGK